VTLPCFRPGLAAGALRAMLHRTQERPSMPKPPSLATLFTVFSRIGMQSFGGGLSGWIRREIVQRRKWLEERPFLSGLAVSQIAPGANAVNLSVFVGTTLRGGPGALAAFAGMMVLPLVIVLAAGALYFRHQALPGVETALSGLGAGAIGLTLATGVRMTRRGVRGARQVAIMAVTAIAIGVLRWPLLPVLVVMIPASLLLAGRRSA
jgi:chromate transporter